ncbi:hypothetical protein CDD83_3777 [Cordyceps sp. RAO-2017]|nr:hypothetical protein CDD83_3777 [Cordyceps sp. RAO-2017]
MSTQADESEPPDSLIDASAGREYWQHVSVNNDGMLGGIPSEAGFGSISRIDLQGSRTFLARLGVGLKQDRRTLARALDGGAGIGRVTEGLLLNVAEQVDVVEPVAKFTDVLKGKAGVGEIFNVGLEEWRPRDGAEYDLIWTQWCLGHLTDEQIVQFLGRCKPALKSDSGIVVIKENLSTSGVDVFDSTDSCVTREDAKFRSLFEKAEMQLVRTELQRGFPETATKKLLPVRMYALKP